VGEITALNQTLPGFKGAVSQQDGIDGGREGLAEGKGVVGQRGGREMKGAGM